jgi:hypothetical protein
VLSVPPASAAEHRRRGLGKTQRRLAHDGSHTIAPRGLERPDVGCDAGRGKPPVDVVGRE